TISAPPVITGGAGGDNTCATDFDCSVGLDGGVGGKCGPDPMRKLPDGGVILTCLCDNTTNAWKCPQVPGESFFSVCPDRPGIQACATSLVCTPPQGMLFQPRGAPDYGCGL